MNSATICLIGLLLCNVANAYPVGSALSLKELTEKADFICKAVVVSSKPVEDPWFDKHVGFAPYATELKIVVVYKGAKLTTASFHHYAMEDSGVLFSPQHYEFETGRTYLVFACKTDDETVFRQIRKDHTIQRDQGVLLAADDSPHPDKSIKEIYWLELTGLLKSQKLSDVRYAIEHLDSLSGGQNSVKQNGGAEFAREDVLEALRQEGSPKIQQAIIDSGLSFTESPVNPSAAGADDQKSKGASPQNTLVQPKPEPREIKVFNLANGNAVECAGLLKHLYPNTSVTADGRTNSVIAISNEKELMEIEAILLKLDESKTNAKPGGPVDVMRADRASEDSLDNKRTAIAEFEEKARRLAEQIRKQSETLGPKHPGRVKNQEELDKTLSTALDLKFQLEQMQLKQLEDRLSRMQTQLQFRKAASRKIVERRMQELLEGFPLDWNSGGSQTVPGSNANAGSDSKDLQAKMGSKARPKVVHVDILYVETDFVDQEARERFHRLLNAIPGMVGMLRERKSGESMVLAIKRAAGQPVPSETGLTAEETAVKKRVEDALKSCGVQKFRWSADTIPPDPGKVQTPAQMAPKKPATNSTQVQFTSPAGMRVRMEHDQTQLTIPDRYNFERDEKETKQYSAWLLPDGVPDESKILAILEFFPVNDRTKEFLAKNSVPMLITDEDLEQFQGRNPVTKVVYLTRDNSQSELQTIVSTRLDPYIDPLTEARRRGEIVMVIRLNCLNPDQPRNCLVDVEIRVRNPETDEIEARYLHGTVVSLDGLVAIPIPVKSIVAEEPILVIRPDKGTARVVGSDDKHELTLIKLDCPGRKLFSWIKCREGTPARGQELRGWTDGTTEVKTRVAETGPNAVAPKSHLPDVFTVFLSSHPLKPGTALTTLNSELQGIIVGESKPPEEGATTDKRMIAIPGVYVEKLIREFRSSGEQQSRVSPATPEAPESKVAEPLPTNGRNALAHRVWEDLGLKLEPTVDPKLIPKNCRGGLLVVGSPGTELEFAL